MAIVPFDGFVGGAYQSRSWKAAAQRCVNMYLEQEPEKGAALYEIPGYHSRATGLTGTPLAILSVSKAIYIFTSSSVWRAELDGFPPIPIIQLLASIDSDYVIAAQAGDRAMFVNGEKGYWTDISVPFAFAEIVDPDFPASPASCTAIDGFFIAHSTDGEQFFWSSPFDPSTWNALDFASAENLNDKLVRAITLERELYLIGEFSTEVWAVVGGDDVFDRIQGTYIPYGTPARLSAATIGQSLLWLSQDQNGGYIALQARGLQSSRVSTHAIEQEWTGYASVVDARAFTYQRHGHLFYVITFPTANKTWVYDLTTQLWHERESGYFVDGGPSIEYGMWRPVCHAYTVGFNFVLMTNSAGVNTNVATLEEGFGELIGSLRRIRTSPHIFVNGEYQTINSLQVIHQPGVGINSVDPLLSNPIATLRISKDGGQTWPVSRQAALGAVGKYLSRLKWNRLGRARDFIAEISVTDPPAFVITGAVLDIE